MKYNRIQLAVVASLVLTCMLSIGGGSLFAASAKPSDKSAMLRAGAAAPVHGLTNEELAGWTGEQSFASEEEAEVIQGVVISLRKFKDSEEIFYVGLQVAYCHHRDLVGGETRGIDMLTGVGFYTIVEGESDGSRRIRYLNLLLNDMESRCPGFIDKLTKKSKALLSTIAAVQERVEADSFAAYCLKCYTNYVSVAMLQVDYFGWRFHKMIDLYKTSFSSCFSGPVSSPENIDDYRQRLDTILNTSYDKFLEQAGQ